MNKGILLINLGTPDLPHPPEVKKYLKEFLMDPWVIDIPYALRWFLVNVLIAPRRSISSAEAYQSIWTDRGSPLKFHLEDLAKKVQLKLSSSYQVAGAMRYQSPSIEAALKKFHQTGVQDVFCIPLYPQYSTAATLSSIEKVKLILKKYNYPLQVQFLEDFYESDFFIRPLAKKIKVHVETHTTDHLLFSYHGLPERQITKLYSVKPYCTFTESCCASIQPENRKCYRAQCFATTRALLKNIPWDPKKSSTSFQSRLGRTPWIKPYTDFEYENLVKKGVRNLAVVVPSFVADCLETLEEIAIRGKEDFLQAGGKSFELIYCLNSDDDWANSLAQMVQEKI